MKVRATIEVEEATEHLGDVIWLLGARRRGPHEGWTLLLPSGKTIWATDVELLNEQDRGGMNSVARPTIIVNLDCSADSPSRSGRVVTIPPQMETAARVVQRWVADGTLTLCDNLVKIIARLANLSAQDEQDDIDQWMRERGSC